MGRLDFNSGIVIVDDNITHKAQDVSIDNITTIIPQETLLFNDSILNNITLGRNFTSHKILDLCSKLGFSSPL